MMIFLVILGLVFLLSFSLYFRQESMLFFPELEIRHTPGDIGLEYEEADFITKDGIAINGWYIPAEPDREVVLFCHGNAGNISDRLDSIKIFHDLGLGVLIFDYRGYGKSAGKISEEGTYMDAEAAWGYLTDVKGKAPGEIIVFGRSLGGAIAAETAVRKKTACLILESTFLSVPAIARKYYPWLPVGLISKYRYNTEEKVAAIGIPKLIIHSRADEIIPFEHGRLLYEKAAEPKQFLEIRGGHNEGFLLSRDIYNEGLMTFIEDCRTTEKPAKGSLR
jgi:uncharacterized protein